MKERLDYIDRTKGILIILMVIGHIWQSGFVFDSIYAFHMPAFFVISGMLMQHTKSYQKPFGRLCKGKILAYGIPFLWIELLGILTDIIRNGMTLNVKGYLYNTLTFNFNDPNLWFLTDLFIIELLVAGMTKTIKRPIVICGIAGALFFVRYLLPVEITYVGTISSVMKYLVFFVAGYCCHKYWKKARIPAALACIMIVLAYVLLGSRISAVGRVWKDLAYVLSGCCGTYAVLCVGRRELHGVLNRMLIKAGKNTIIIYGTHHVYYAAVGLLLGVRDFASTPIWAGFIMLAAVAILEIATIYIFNRWLPFLAGKHRKYTKPLDEKQEGNI